MGNSESKSSISMQIHNDSVHKRNVTFREQGVMKNFNCSIYDRRFLAPGDSIKGPCIIEEDYSTIVVHPNDIATVDNTGNILIKIQAGGGV
jgi:N-methylhydantoinase A/oxoprolinase/acetone carboxylase beta subunit